MPRVKTDSAANQFGASQAHNPARHNSAFEPLHLPLARQRSGPIMSASHSPAEVCGHVISSILNLVCPQCGGRMSEFQCDGRCRRNWLAEWQWANRETNGKRSRPK